MSARTAILLGHDGEPQFTRWLLAGAIMLAAHVGVVAIYLLLRPPLPSGAPAAPVVIMELSPIPVAPASPADLAPGPEMQEAPGPIPTERIEVRPLAAPVVADLPPLPPMPEAAVVGAPLPLLPEVKPEPKVEPKPPDPQVKPVERQEPAPRTAAAPRSERKTAAKSAAPAPGSAETRAAIADWQSLVISRLLAARRSVARRNEGIVTVGFIVSRGGGVLSLKVVRSSGVSELDQEALVMVQRAAPFPPFPSGMTQASQNLTVPIRFVVR